MTENCNTLLATKQYYAEGVLYHRTGSNIFLKNRLYDFVYGITLILHRLCFAPHLKNKIFAAQVSVDLLSPIWKNAPRYNFYTFSKNSVTEHSFSIGSASHRD